MKMPDKGCKNVKVCERVMLLDLEYALTDTIKMQGGKNE